MRNLKQPFFGMPEDRSILGDIESSGASTVRFSIDIDPKTNGTGGIAASGGPPWPPVPEDAAIIGQEPDMVASMGDGTSELETQELIPGAVKTLHPDCREKGTSVALGFMPHQGENRATRRKASATWVPPKTTQKDAGAGGTPPAPDMPTRRELFEQRRKHQRGKLDPELRRLQRKAIKNGTSK